MSVWAMLSNHSMNELVQFRAKLKFRALYSKLPLAMQNKVRNIITDDDLSWVERLGMLKVDIINHRNRAARITVCQQRYARKWTMREQLIGVVEDIGHVCNYISSIFGSSPAYQTA